MAPRSDFLKISTYHDILGPRLAHRLKAGYCQTIFRGLAPEEALAFFYAVASGIVVCREYEEMHEASLRAVGRAVGERGIG